MMSFTSPIYSSCLPRCSISRLYSSEYAQHSRIPSLSAASGHPQFKRLMYTTVEYVHMCVAPFYDTAGSSGIIFISCIPSIESLYSKRVFTRPRSRSSTHKSTNNNRKHAVGGWRTRSGRLCDAMRLLFCILALVSISFHALTFAEGIVAVSSSPFGPRISGSIRHAFRPRITYSTDEENEGNCRLWFTRNNGCCAVTARPYSERRHVYWT